MYVKKLNMEPCPLSNKIVKLGEIPFKLWLEFEEFSPWDELDNDFANIGVDTLDGRSYGINVWTFKFLESSIKHDKENEEHLNGLYQIPPDLFVKELSRDCIERTIADLLENGNLEELLNHSIFGLEYLEPYQDAMAMKEEDIQVLMNQLKVESPKNHLLQSENVELIARTSHNNDIVLELSNGNVAVVPLTWEAKIKESPIIRVYSDKIDFWAKEMKHNIIEFKNV